MGTEPPFISSDEGHARIGEGRIPTTSVEPPFNSREHIAGRPVNATTYQRYGCRCDGCRADQNEKMTRYRRKGRTRLQSKVSTRKRDLAAQWIRQNRPDVWALITEQAYAHVGLERTVPDAE